MLKVHPRGHRAEKKQTTKAAIREAYLNGPRRGERFRPFLQHMS